MISIWTALAARLFLLLGLTRLSVPLLLGGVDGCLRHNPRADLGAYLKQQLGDLVLTVAGSSGARLGVDCGDGTAVSLIEYFYRVGFRAYVIPVSASAGKRLAFGQFAIRRNNHE
jgi:pyruvate,orthophosphate dikinase